MADQKNRAPRFNPKSDKSFRISRTKIDLFLKCPRCFYLNQRLGLKIPGSPPFGLNIRIDTLIKKDADLLRLQQKLNPRAQKFGINAVPFNHPKIKQWLDIFNSTGLEHHHTATNLTICGAPDDIWLVNNTSLSIVDVKATHSNKTLEESYFWTENKRQVELYSWLLTQQELSYPVSETSYFVRINTKKSQNSFDSNGLEFDDEVISHTGSNAWVEPTLTSLKTCLTQDNLPVPSKECDYCKYRATAVEIEKEYKKDRA